MKTIFDHKVTPYELTLLTGSAMTKEHYMQSGRDVTQMKKDLFRLHLIRREKQQAWDFLESMDPHDADILKENELIYL